MADAVVPLLTAILSIVVINLVLSGDNAVVIGLAAHQLPPRLRRKAILIGGLGAVGLRVLFTALATVLLTVPFLQAVGGVVLIWIALRLLRQEDSTYAVASGDSLLEATRTIVVADAIMSLDNILAVGGAAHGSLGLLLFGLGLSMPIILFGGGLVANLMNRLPWLVYLGVAVLIYTGVEMTLDDQLLQPYVPHEQWFGIGLALTVAAVAIGAAYWWNVRRPARLPAPVAEPASVDD